METVSMIVAGVILFTAIYGLTGMILRRPRPAVQEVRVRTPEQK